MRYEYYSNLALVSSAVVYMLAMFAHAAEWAAARKLSVADPAERELAAVTTSAQPVEMRPEPPEMRPEPPRCALSLSKGKTNQTSPRAAASSNLAGWA